MFKNFTTTVKPINSNIIIGNTLSEKDKSLTIMSNSQGSFNFEEDTVELYVYSLDHKILSRTLDFKGYKIDSKNINVEENVVGNMILDPVESLYNLGFTQGTSIVLYNFISNELNSSFNNEYYIKEISSNRRELRLSHINMDWVDLEDKFTNFKSRLDVTDFEGFYLTFEDNEYIFALNIELDVENEEILILLYNPLPSTIEEKDQCYITTKKAQSEAYEVEFTLNENYEELGVIKLQGPNTNLELGDFINPTTELKSKEDLIENVSTKSKDHLSNVLNRDGVFIKPNYKDFKEFINFSSAKSRILNFIDKVNQIHEIQNKLSLISTLNPNSSGHSDKLNMEGQIQDIIKNFDAYEYYLYYSEESESYPKVGTQFPLTLLPTNDPIVLNWLGDDVENSQYYGGILLKASKFDNSNPNWLYYTIPEFIRDNEDNSKYIDFLNMIGQHFDEIWLYIKAIAEKNNTTNELDSGIPLKLAQDAIESLGFKGLSNNFNSQGNYIGLTGEDDGVLVPPTGSEFIENYIAVNNGEITNYWNLQYSNLNYVEDQHTIGFPYAIDDVSKEIFKRLYHNMSFLVKKKGTVAGLRQLINIWGIPDTTLRISEFGGKNTKDINDYDLWYNRYNFAYSPTSNQHKSTSTIRIPWTPVPRTKHETVGDGGIIVPDALMFRFKTEGYPESEFGGSYHTQSLFIKKSNEFLDNPETDFGVFLFHKEQPTGSYSGSSLNEYEGLGDLKLYIKDPSTPEGFVTSSAITLPFYNKEWWSVMVTRDTQVSTSINTENVNYNLYVKSKPLKGENSNQIKYAGFTNIQSNGNVNINSSWNKFSTDINWKGSGIFLGGEMKGAQFGETTILPEDKIFSGSFQEFRLYSQPIEEKIFDSYVMNPRSIEGYSITGSLSSYNILNFRAPLGNELTDIFNPTSTNFHIEPYKSLHPSVGKEFYEESFIQCDGATSEYDVIYYQNGGGSFSKPNVEEYFLDSPSMGVKNRLTNKIEVVENDNYEDTLSIYKSIEQNYPKSQPYTPNQNHIEVAFSPQNEINDEIINSFGNIKLSELLGDPRNLENGRDYYPELRKVANEYFKKYSKGNVYDYLRLMKYFDNSIFKAIKNYSPARSSITTGIVVKSHLLERNKYSTPKILNQTHQASTPEGDYNTPLILENLEIDSNLDTWKFEGGTGGTFEPFNHLSPADFNQIPISQSWDENIITPLGVVNETLNTQKEFYDGEFKGNLITVSTQSWANNPILNQEYQEVNYNVNVVNGGLYHYINEGGSLDVRLIVRDVNDRELSPHPLELFSDFISGDLIISLLRIAPGEFIIDGLSISSTHPNNRGWREILHEIKGTYPDSPIPYGIPNDMVGYYKPPNFTIKLPPPTAGEVKSGMDPILPNLTHDIINSATLAVKETWITKPPPGPVYHPRRIFLFETDPQFLEQYPQKLIKGTPDLDWDNGMYQIHRSLERSDFKFLSLNRFKNESQQNILQNQSNEGEIRIYMQPITHSLGGSFEGYYPILTSINVKDLNGNSYYDILNNIFNYEVELTPLTPPTIDSNGLHSNIVNSSYLDVNNSHYEESIKSFIYYYKNVGRLNSHITSSLNNLVEFDPFILEGTNIENSEYNPLNNNVELGRPNKNLMEVDYLGDANIPINLRAIKLNRATRASVAKSNYSMKGLINARYLGSKFKSAQYNRYTPKVRISPLYLTNTLDNLPKPPITHFINWDTGMWEGDSSYGKNSVIDIHPKYIAYFDKSYEDYNKLGTYKFNLNQLIEIPNEILNPEDVLKFENLKLKGSNDNLDVLTGNFDLKGKVVVDYNPSLKSLIQPINQIENLSTFNNLPKTLDSSGVEYQTIFSNQIKGNVTTEYYNFERFGVEEIESPQPPTIIKPIEPSDPESSIPPQLRYAEQVLMVTGSGFLQLSGSMGEYTNFHQESNLLTASLEPNIEGFLSMKGPQLAVINTYNQCLANRIEFDPNLIASQPLVHVGVTPNLNPLDESHYFKWSPSGSKMEEYENFDQSFTLKKGDEIRTQYKIMGTSTQPERVITQDFTITKILQRQVKQSHIDPTNKYTFKSGLFNYEVGQATIFNIFDRVEVTPNPETLDNPIPRGRISSVTIRRRVETDNRLMVKLPTRQNSNGYLTPTQGGFIIPENFSQIQKENTLNVINHLRSKNAFRTLGE